MNAFFRQLKWELRKLFTRKRTYIGFAAYLVFEIALLSLMQGETVRTAARRKIERAGYTFRENFTGPTVAASIMGTTMTVLGSLYIALVAGEIVAKEVEDGTMRMLLCRPISRLRILTVKLATCLLYTCAITVFIASTAMVIGVLVEGPGNFLIMPLKEDFVVSYEFWPGLGRYCAAVGLQTMSVFTITTLAFMLSCLKMKPVAATTIALSVLVIDETLRDVPFFASLQPYFLMTHVTAWIKVYEFPIPWGNLLQNYAFLFALNGVFVWLGWNSFRKRDFKL
jgi:ABC-2 type transport system permease protein